MKTKWIWLTSITLLAALLLSGTVFAEGTEPPALPEGPSAPMDPAAVVVEAPAVVVEAAPAAEVPVIEEALPDAAPAAEPVAAEAVVLGIVEEPQVALVDAQGEPMDLASQASADLISSGDPWWKVGSTTYKTNFVGLCPSAELNITCWESDSPISLALTHIVGGLLPTDRKLYVEAGDYTETVIIGSSLSQMKGLIGVNGSTLTTITGNVDVSNTVSGFTLSGFTVHGRVIFGNNTGPLLLQDLDVYGNTFAGIRVNPHSGSITLKNVKSHNNVGGSASGAYLVTTSGNVSISDSIFNHNGSDGVYFSTQGTTSLTNVIASENANGGIYVSGHLGVTLKNVVANDNALNHGIYISAESGNMTLENITASGNGPNGIEAILDSPINVTIKNLIADNNDENGLLLRTMGAVTITNSQTNGNISGNGLDIWTSGRVTLNSIRSSENGVSGLHIKGIEETSEITPGDYEITSVASPASVAITSPKNAAQSNVFDGNGAYGIWIETNKPVSISNFSASGNPFNHGVMVEGFWYYQLNPDGVTYTYTETFAGATTITATIPNYNNQINNNGTNGIRVDSSGNVKLERTNANGNTFRGIEVNTLGTITLKDVKANGNGAEAVKLFNKDALTAKAVTVTNAETSDNTGIKGRGLDIESRGIVKVTTLKSINNSELGLNINNTAGGSGSGSITLTNLTLNENYSAGMEVFSNGAISLKDVTANDNGGKGVMAQNDNLGIKASITLTNVQANDNNSSGMEVYSNGAISLKDVTANNNGGTGVIAQNYGLGIKAGITLTHVHANGNNGDGIAAYTNGTLVVKDAEASNNAVTSGTIEDTTTAQDFYNQSKGPDKWWFWTWGSTPYTLRMQADSDDSLNPLSFNPFMVLHDGLGNHVSGTITSSTDDYYQIAFTTGPAGGGYYYLEASSTTNDGFYRLSVNDPVPSESSTDYYWPCGFDYDIVGNATFSGTNTFNGNSVSGLIGWNNGNVTASNITASDNGTEGIRFDNTGGLGNVTLSGTNISLNNGWQGLQVDTNGTVKVTNFDGSGNGQDGVSIVANTAGKAVTLTHVTVLNNTLRGLDVKADGNITLSNIRANDNVERGIYLENCTYSGTPGVCPGTGNITMSGFNEASNNHLNGMDVMTNGTVTISNLEVNSNINSGIAVDAFGINKKVTLNFVRAMGNDGSGLYIRSNGLTTLNTVHAWLNTLDGANIISEGSPIVVKFSSFIANDRSGLVYGLYTAPFTFTNLSNVFLGNGLSDLQPIV